jgi:hypothetical protein
LGYSQIEGKDFQGESIFAPTLKYTSARTIIAVAASMKWKVSQMDVVAALLQGELTEEIYMEPPKGLQGIAYDEVLLLKKSLYGLKQAPRIWNDFILCFKCA